MRQSDSELIEMSRAGDEDAAEEVLARYKNLVNSLCRRYFLAGADVEDLIQEGMLGLYKAAAAFDTEKNIPFAAYAAECVKNAVISAVRKASAGKHKPLNEYSPMDVLEFFPSASEGPEQIVIEQERLEEVRANFRGLSDKEFSVLIQYLKGKSYKEIAAACGITAKSVDNSIARIKLKLA